MNKAMQRGFTLIEMMVVVAIISVLSGFMISVSARTYGASAESVSNDLVAAANLAKMRAVSSRHYQRLEVTPTKVHMWEWSDPGITPPSGTCTTSPVSHCWQLVQTVQIQGTNKVYDASGTVYAASGTSVASNGSLDFMIDFKPDGSSTGATLFVGDKVAARRWRVLVYKATSSAYSREIW
jgi:prepilin-type N-terminal cleavage/methylation domain-containing protein